LTAIADAKAYAGPIGEQIGGGLSGGKSPDTQHTAEAGGECKQD